MSKIIWALRVRQDLSDFIVWSWPEYEKPGMTEIFYHIVSDLGPLQSRRSALGSIHAAIQIEAGQSARFKDTGREYYLAQESCE